MHDRLQQVEFLTAMAGPLGWYYLLLAAANLAAAVLLWRSAPATSIRQVDRLRLSGLALWLLFAGLFGLNSWLAFRGDAAALGWVAMPAAVKDAVDSVLSPTWFTLGSMALLAALFLARRFFVQPIVAGLLLNLSLWFLGASLTDPDFAKIVGKPDNIAIVGMIYLLAYFTWLGASLAVRNDGRMARGEPPLEALGKERVLVWPDLVYIELIAMVAGTAVLIAWALAVQAPLEDPANAALTPNPSKAPWYFLGLQELLVYFDPWLAGVVLPGLILFGLIAIPYLDKNPAGNGYYTIAQRPFAYVTFQFGFLVLWIALILMGTFLRGPGWSFFGIYETWDPHRSELLPNHNLSDLFWVGWLGRELPTTPAGAESGVIWIFWRELPGLLLMAVYFAALPVALAAGTPFFRQLYRQMGRARFVIMMFLLLMMFLVPIKMLASWTWNLKYLIAIPEWSFNL